MNVKLMVITAIFIASVMVLGCAKKQSRSRTAKLLEGEQDVDLVEHLTGIDDSTSVNVKDSELADPHATEAASEPTGETGDVDEDVIGGGQGAFLGRLMINGQEAKGTFTVKHASASQSVVKQDISTGKEIRLSPGLYDFTFTTKAIVGKPELTLRDVEIRAGKRLKRDVKFPVGKITLVTGGRCAKKRINIKQKGATDWYPGKFYTCVEMTLMAGEYEAEMVKGKRGTPIRGIQVYDGGTRDVLIRPE